MKSYSNRRPSLLLLLTLVASLLSFTSCEEDDDMIYDYMPVEVMVHIQDAEGNNLLSPTVAGNLRGKKIVALYEGEEYELNWDSAEPSRYYLPFFKGLTFFTVYTESGEPDINKSYLTFGEFDGAQNQDVAITLSIEGYSRSWEIAVSHRLSKKSQKVTNSATLDGKKVSYYDIVIVP